MGKEYRHLRVLREQLQENADAETSSKILDGIEYIKDNSNPEIKAQWADEVTRRMDACLDVETCIKIRENCACLKSNEKSIYAQTFRRLRKKYSNNSDYLNAVVEYLNSTTPLRRCGEVSLDDDKIITVIAREHCDCQVIAKGQINPISVTWCHCCKGSILSVLKYIFPQEKCNIIIIETYASGGKTCTFQTTFERI
jgi:hypothetical protein